MPTCRKCLAELNDQAEGHACPTCGSLSRMFDVDVGDDLGISELIPSTRAAMDKAIESLSGANRLSDELAKARQALIPNRSLTAAFETARDLNWLRQPFGSKDVIAQIRATEAFAQKAKFQSIFDSPQLQAAKLLAEFNQQIDKKAFASLSDVALAKRMIDEQFRRPLPGEVPRLIAELDLNPVSKLLRDAGDMQASLRSLMGSIKAPFLDIHSAAKSAAAVAELQGISKAIAATVPFDESLAKALRSDLGDWRETIDWSKHDLVEIDGRIDLYVERGFDTSLVDMPSAAFDQVLDLTGYTDPRPSLDEQFGPPIVRPVNEEDEAIDRTNEGHRWLLVFERELRAFIDDVMTKTIGPGWEHQRVDPKLAEAWVNRRETEKKSGMQPQPLLAYADFTDYERIITRKDNWKSFQTYFRREEIVRESLQRLYPVRLATMHARLLTQEDQILMYAEIRRFGRVLRSRPS
jgi:hypothetical protein